MNAVGAGDISELLAKAQAWQAGDIDDGDRDELTGLIARATATDPAIAAAAVTDLASRFAGPLEFGTAGLRGAMGAGETRMNRAVVVRAAAGLGAYLTAALAEIDPRGLPPVVVIGFDARHRSAAMAADSAAVLTAAGLRVVLQDAPRPTPVLAFAVRALGADAGIMVTASHNPAADNGYKVYLGGRIVTDWGQGAQIVPPYDSAIAVQIAAQPNAADIARAASGWETLGDEIAQRYLAALPKGAQPPVPVRIVTTAMHGVGDALLTAALNQAGFTDIHPVPAQQHPDPTFPTVAFPNPEEPGALDLAMALAQEVEADLILAVDPDADRCAVAVPDPYAPAGGTTWRRLHGDELGSAIGETIAARLAALPSGSLDSPGPTIANSIVSSRLLGRIAAHHAVAYAQTLTGFKWISRVPGLVFGYEEALGYCTDPARVRDKDGISASLGVARLVAALRSDGHTHPLVDLLDDIARQHGLYVSGQVNVRFPDPAALRTTVARIIADAPTHLGGAAVTETTDLSRGADGVPPTTGLRLIAADGSRVIIRPSGTEPKVKAYLEVIEAVQHTSDRTELATARRNAAARLDALAEQIQDLLTQQET